MSNQREQKNKRAEKAKKVKAKKRKAKVEVAAEPTKAEDEPNDFRCVKCEKDAGECGLCYGCGKVVCDDCNVNMNMPWGKHPAELHFVESFE